MIADRYRALLEHLGPTVPLTELRRSAAADLVAMRHDIDHDLGVALDLSAMERAVGDRRATYFILHTHPYCSDPRFLDRLRQLVDDGHEIGLHLDALGAWWRGEADDPFGDLERWLDRVRGAGIEVVASAAHGARACYEGGFANHWIWSELRGEDPAATMDGISAEGVAVDDPAFQLRYPADHRVRRADGATLDLWTCSMASFGIESEACTVPVDGYWSDSGGQWTRSPDPTTHDLSFGRHQVLVHPWWWQAPRRDTLVLTTAGSGAAWMCGRFEAGTSALVLNDRTLNQQGRTLEPAPGLERTAGDLVGLLRHDERVATLVEHAFEGRARERRDTVEVNVHLPHVDPELLRRDRVTVVHLHRDPAMVVRSILEQGWYDTPDDRRHPRFEVEGWEAMGRVERACVYWSETNRRLLQAFPDAIRVAFEDLQADPAAVRDLAARLGFDWHEIPAAPEDAPADLNESWSIPPVDAWNDTDRRIFVDACGPVARLLGRALDPALAPADPVFAPPRDTPAAQAENPPPIEASAPMSGAIVGGVWCAPASRRGGVVAVGDTSGATIELRPRLSMGDRWRGCRAMRRGEAVVAGRIRLAARGPRLAARLVLIEQDAHGRTVVEHDAVRIEPGLNEADFSLRLRTTTRSVRPEIRIDHVEGEWRVQVTRLGWSVRSLPSPAASRERPASPPLFDLPADRCDQKRIAHRRRKLHRPRDYRTLLEDFAGFETLTLQAYARLPEHGDRRILVIRHDVDHDLETAVEMAAWEAANGVRSTYSLLHTAWYWGEFDGRRYRHSTDLVRAGARILELGHEINLHNNLATLALQTGCDPAAVLDAELRFMRDLGWPVTGTATHGDALCRELGFRNFELFAHAVKPEFGGPRTILSPHGGVRLGGLELADFGLEYEAYDLHRDLMVTDSGGRLLGQRNVPGRRWFGRDDPTRGTLASLLTHPIWWDFGPSAE